MNRAFALITASALAVAACSTTGDDQDTTAQAQSDQRMASQDATSDPAALSTDGYAAGLDEDPSSADAEYAMGDTANDDDQYGYQSSEDGVPPSEDDTSPSTYTANTTDAYSSDGNLITGSEAARLAGTYTATVPTGEGDAMEDVILYIEGTGNEASGTFDGLPIEVAVTGSNLRFDAPLPGGDPNEIVTYTGTFADGQITNGVVGSQGDGTSMDWSAERTSDADMMDDAGATPDMDM